MTKFKLITYRIGITVAAIALGIFLVLLLTYMGQNHPVQLMMLSQPWEMVWLPSNTN
ncbi:MAG: hypothetical protein IPP32_17660 [Bacteroidetes bacterium]|nr:hypothetical protein [Bacteroidota bacterium]